jgi:hypothetical protein
LVRWAGMPRACAAICATAAASPSAEAMHDLICCWKIVLVDVALLEAIDATTARVPVTAGGGNSWDEAGRRCPTATSTPPRMALHGRLLRGAVASRLRWDCRMRACGRVASGESSSTVPT